MVVERKLHVRRVTTERTYNALTFEMKEGYHSLQQKNKLFTFVQEQIQTQTDFMSP